MNALLFFVLTGLILLFSLYLGKKSSLAIQNHSDFFLSSRNLGLFKVSMTILATQLGGGAIIGTAEAAYNYGWVAISYSLGIALGLTILALGVGAKFRNMEIGTIPEIFDKKYNSTVFRKISSALYITSMFFILVAIGVSARKFSLAVGMHSNIVFIAFWLIIIAYTTSGGLNAVTQTDILQVIFILAAFIITFVFLINTEINYKYIGDNITSKDVPWINWLFFPCLFSVIGQDMAQRCFAAKSPKDISRATIIAAILLLVASLLPTYLGVIAYKIGMSNASNSSVLIQVVERLTNPYITSVFACAILMAILSTADSLLCAISSNVTLDFFISKHDEVNVGSTKISKIITIIIGLSAMFCSFLTEDIIPVMVIAYEISACALFIPVIMTALLKKTPSKISIYLSCISGIACFVVLNIFNACGYKAMFAIIASFTLFLVSEITFRLLRRQIISK